MEEFVEKSLAPAAIVDVANELLKKQFKKLINRGDGTESNSKIEKESQIREILERESLSLRGTTTIDSDGDQPVQSSNKRPTEKRKAAGSKGRKTYLDNHENDDDSDNDNIVLTSKKYCPSERVTKRDRNDDEKNSSDENNFGVPSSLSAKASLPMRSSSPSNHMRDYSDSDDAVDEVSDMSRLQVPKRPKRAAAAKRVAEYAFDSDEEEEDPIVESDEDEVRSLDKSVSKYSTTVANPRINKKNVVSKTTRSKKVTGYTYRHGYEDSDEGDEILETNEDLAADWGSAATKSQFYE